MKPTDDIRKLLSEKFENFEAEPQDNSWENIRFALDLKDKFNTYEAEPQEETFSKILLATQLTEKFKTYEVEPQDDSFSKILLATQLTEKFKDYEAEPQEDSFSKILLATQLTEKFKDYEAEPQAESDETIMAATLLREKFNNYEAEPQTDTWTTIQLAAQLGQKFSNFEAEPQAESWQKIKDAIKPEKERRVIFWPFAYRVGIAASIALILGFGWLLYNNKTETSHGIAINKKADNQVIKPSKAPLTEESIAQNGSSNNTKNIVGNGSKNANLNGGKLRNQANELLNNGDKVAINKTSSTEKSNILKNKISAKNNTENIANNISRKSQKKHQSKTVLEKQSSNESLANETQKTDNELNITNNAVAVTKPNQTKANQNAESPTLDLLDSKDFKQRNIRLPFGEIAYNNERPMEEPQERIRRKMILTSSIMPLQTYQALTILPQTSAYIQQVSTLNALDAQRLGVQARIGVMQPLSNRFSTGVSVAYSGIRQSVSYEVNNGTYDVDLTNAQNTLIGVGEAVSQNKFLHTVGLKLDNSYLVSNKKNKVFVLGGAEAVRVLNDNQYAYYLNASVALAYPTKGGKTVWIEPTYRYSLSQSLDANNYLQIRPSNIGLNVRVNFM
jgi:hypothetical protein